MKMRRAERAAYERGNYIETVGVSAMCIALERIYNERRISIFDARKILDELYPNELRHYKDLAIEKFFCID